jgi:hypothetical protein
MKRVIRAQLGKLVASALSAAFALSGCRSTAPPSVAMPSGPVLPRIQMIQTEMSEVLEDMSTLDYLCRRTHAGYSQPRRELLDAELAKVRLDSRRRKHEKELLDGLKAFRADLAREIDAYGVVGRAHVPPNLRSRGEPPR